MRLPWWLRANWTFIGVIGCPGLIVAAGAAWGLDAAAAASGFVVMLAALATLTFWAVAKLWLHAGSFRVEASAARTLRRLGERFDQGGTLRGAFVYRGRKCSLFVGPVEDDEVES